MYADIEQLVLSGKLFNGEERSSSPERSPSPDHIPHKDWPDDAIENHESDQEDDLSDSERAKLHPSSMQPARGPREPIGMGPGRTGVKGVIRDRNEAVQRNRERRAKEIEALNRKMEKASLGGKTFLEEEREREWEKARLEGLSVPPGVEKGSRKGKFGHLREVGAEGFVKAVENERGIWVVMHIYDPSLDRCADIDAVLTRLARTSEDVKFLRARASSLGFASTSSPSKFSDRLGSHASSSIRRPSRPSRIDEDDEDDPYAYEDKTARNYDDEGDDAYSEDDDDVDTDMLPTLLVYRDGQLVHNWVRVDWEAGKAGVEELLSRHHVLRGTGPGLGNCGLPSDDDDLFDSDFDM